MPNESTTAVTEPIPAKARPTVKPRPLPPHAVVLHDDPVNGIDYVVGVLRQVVRCTTARAWWLTITVHRGGRGVVWAGSLEVAELKAEQIRAAGPDPRKAARGAGPLKVTVERLPG